MTIIIKQKARGQHLRLDLMRPYTDFYSAVNHVNSKPVLNRIKLHTSVTERLYI